MSLVARLVDPDCPASIRQVTLMPDNPIQISISCSKTSFEIDCQIDCSLGITQVSPQWYMFFAEMCESIGVSSKSSRRCCILELFDASRPDRNQRRSWFRIFRHGRWLVPWSSPLVCLSPVSEILDVSDYSGLVEDINWRSHVAASVAEGATRALLPVGQDPPRPLGDHYFGLQPGKNIRQQLLPRLKSLLQCCKYLLISPYPTPVISRSIMSIMIYNFMALVAASGIQCSWFASGGSPHLTKGWHCCVLFACLLLVVFCFKLNVR